MNFRSLISVLFFSVLVVACSDINVKSDSAGASFVNYSRFAWHADTSGEMSGLKRLANEQIIAAVNSELSEKGYVKTEQNADFLVNYQVMAEDLVDVQEVNVYSGYGPGFVLMESDGIVRNETYLQGKEYEIQQYRKGTLIIDIIDADSNRLTWRAVADKRVENTLNNDERMALISKAVKKMFKGIPSAQH